MSEGEGADKEAVVGGGDDPLASLIGVGTGTEHVVVERGAVAFFAAAVLDDSPEYRRPDAAAAAGFTAIPAPPTYPIALSHWGAFDELQPGPVQSGMVAALALVRPYLTPGGVLLHGEQEFEYDRPVLVGDVLTGASRISDIYTKDSKGKTMTFVVNETRWTDGNGAPVVTVRANLIWRA